MDFSRLNLSFRRGSGASLGASGSGQRGGPRERRMTLRDQTVKEGKPLWVPRFKFPVPMGTETFKAEKEEAGFERLPPAERDGQWRMLATMTFQF